MNKRIWLGVGVLVLFAVLVLGVDFVRRQNTVLEPGSVPVYYRGRMVGSFLPQDLEKLEQASFVDAEEGKTQEGWLLRDALLLSLDIDIFRDDTAITVSSSSRSRSATVTWAQANDEANRVLLDLSSRGTLKLVSTLEELDTRAEWVQDLDKVEVE